MIAALGKHVRKLPQELRRSLTWDCGKEMADTRASSSPPPCGSISAIRAVLASAAATRTQTACRDGILRGGTDLSRFSRNRQSFSSHTGNRLEGAASSEMLEHGKSHLLDDMRISAVEQKNIEADRKGQRGEYAEQHGLILRRAI